jgi:hypothetical protein
VFSAAGGGIITQRRTRLTDENARMLVQRAAQPGYLKDM